MGRAILVVEDDTLMRSFLVDVLAAEGHRVESAADGTAGLDRIEREAWDLVITDLKMPGLDGLALLREGRKIRPEARWIVITAHGSIESAVEAMKAGATDYLLKPFKSPDELRLVVRRALREVESEARIALLSEELGRDFPPSELIFLGAAMERLRDMVREVAPTTANVLLAGASGTGKEVLARVIHAWSPRRDQPFVAVNCAALAESLLESELFGHERGAFTGAVAARKGRFELADGGTLLLDEVGEIAPSVQVKLLRVLQERVIERVGGVRPVPVDVQGHRRHEPGSQGAGRGGDLPRRPVLPSQCFSPASAAPGGARGCGSPAGGLFPREILAAIWQTSRSLHGCGARRSAPVRVARKYPGAPECRRAGGYSRPWGDRYRPAEPGARCRPAGR